jgi:LPS-assembly protein
MKPFRRRTSSPLRAALLAGVAAALSWHGAALAQASAFRPAPKAVVPDGLKPDELYLEADSVARDDNNKVTTAEGSVEVRYQNRTLRADKVVYTEGAEKGQGVIRAYGHVQIINADGSVEFADEIDSDDKMQAGVAQNFSARMPVVAPGFGALESKLAAATVVRRSEDVQELNKAIFTPCPICADSHHGNPTWSVSADRVLEDKEKHIIYYRHATIRILGVPVIYMPVFWHADPSAERASGLLAPKLGYSDRRGFSYQQPYVWVISPYADLTLSPQINTKVNPFLNTRYREAFYSGDIDLRVGYTHDYDFDGQGNSFGDNTNRSYILGKGGFRPATNWITGFTAERVSDKLIFDKYDIGDAFIARGPFVADDRRLLSSVYAMRQDVSSYFSAAVMSFQGLRSGDNDRTFPLVGPYLDDHNDISSNFLGGRLQADASAVVLTRDQSPTDTTQRLPGMDSRRVTGQLDWRADITTSFGLRISPFVQARADAYSVSDILTGATTQANPVTTSKSLARGLGVAGADISYPVFRRFGDATVVLEPLAQIDVSPKAHQVVVGYDATTHQPLYLNEDSSVFEFDETTLFRPNKFPGYDLYEDGTRLNVGGRGTVLWDDGRQAQLLIGRSYRTETNNVFPVQSGLQQKSSDWVVATDAQLTKEISFFARALLDSDTLEAHRLETGLNVSNARWGTGYIRYFQDDSNAFAQSTNNLVTPAPGGKVRNMDLGGELRFTKNWGMTVYGNRDLIQQAWVIRTVGVFYRDDCTRVDVIYQHEDTVIGRLGPTDSVTVRLTLATLGSTLNVR